jgi:hypothetical protein
MAVAAQLAHQILDVVVELDGHDSAAKKFGHSHSGLLLSEDK